ncbi:response regulator [candidate division CSSED10-310 bacterium]|uniref:Response regulator n=1 Tax=candidate division CSSED10-310 bacterium TaxID=2855610 RepID=A0ABV6Z257_UNCC1
MILFIDDQALLTKPIRDILIDIGGYNVLYAMSYDEAQITIKLNIDKIKLVLIDIMMPAEEGHPPDDKFGLSTGLRLGQWVKQLLPDVPIFALTVRDDISTDELKTAGIEEIFVKPVNPQELLTKIEEYLGSQT